MKIIVFLLFCVLIFGCTNSSKNKTSKTNDSIASQSDNGQQIKKWIKIYVGNSVFDSIQLNSYRDSQLESNKIGIYKFFCYHTDGVYYNFMGLVDTTKRKWIIKTICKDSKDELVFPKFVGVTTDHKYFLLSFGDTGGSGVYEIYNQKGSKVFNCVAQGGDNIVWTKNDEFEYWGISNNDTLPKLDGMQEAWLQKFIWKDEKLISTNAIKKGFVE